MKKNNLYSFMTFLSLLTLLTFISCDHDKHEQKQSKYLVTKPWKKDLEVTKDYVAQIRAIQHIEIRAFEKGYLESIYVDEGQSIEKGQKMFQIMPLLMKAEYDKAKAEYDVTEIEYKNTSNLARRKVVSQNELALAKAKLNKSKAELDLAKTHLDFTSISAPFNGIMDRFQVRLGSLIDEGQLLTTLSDNSQMWVYFNVSESHYLNYMKENKNKDSATIKLKLANGDIFDQIGKIDTIEADFNSENGNVAFRASFPNPNGLLRHGETGNILLTEPLHGALVIPQKATYEVLDKKFVYVIDDKNIVQSRQITVGEEVPHLFVVTSGLSENDTVLLEGLGKVHLGDKVDTKFENPEMVMEGLKLAVD